MPVDVTLRTRDGTEYACRLCNLSVGGCLLSLAGHDGVDRQTRTALCDLRLHFPNGHRLEVDGYVRRVYRASGRPLTYIGVRFEEDVDEKQRRLWFYVCEIEREAVRQTNGREGLCTLTPSRLFIGARKSELRPHPVADVLQR